MPWRSYSAIPRPVFLAFATSRLLTDVVRSSADLTYFWQRSALTSRRRDLQRSSDLWYSEALGYGNWVFFGFMDNPALKMRKARSGEEISNFPGILPERLLLLDDGAYPWSMVTGGACPMRIDCSSSSTNHWG